MRRGASGHRYCGRHFTPLEIERIRGLIAAKKANNRTQLSRLVCEELGWFRPDGRPKDMACRVAMLRMERDGLVRLPPAERRNGNGRTRPRLTSASAPQAPIVEPAHALPELVLRPVVTRADSALWNELIERYHYLGYTPLAGAQIRYLAFSGRRLLAAMGVGAAAWALAPRDRFIGWTADARRRNLHRVVNQARFLILPWVHSPNLASRLLARAVKRLPRDWEERYGYAPVLVETFVERDRFRATSYRAANWIAVGQTQGRGKMDRRHRRALPVKEILLYPLTKRFRTELCR